MDETGGAAGVQIQLRRVGAGLDRDAFDQAIEDRAAAFLPEAQEFADLAVDGDDCFQFFLTDRADPDQLRGWWRHKSPTMLP